MPKANIISDYYDILEAEDRCLECGEPMTVFGFLLPHGHRQHDEGEWRVWPAPAALLEIEFLSREVQTEIRARTRSFRKGANGEWLNHCADCGAGQEDAYVHDHTGTPLSPVT